MKYTVMEAFAFMQELLEKYYKVSQSDDIGALLGDTMLLEDNSTADPAAWFDWKDSILKVKGFFEENMHLDIQESYMCVIDFLGKYGKRINSVEVLELVKEMQSVGRENAKYRDDN